MKIKCIIIDDEPLAISVIKNILKLTINPIYNELIFSSPNRIHNILAIGPASTAYIPIWGLILSLKNNAAIIGINIGAALNTMERNPKLSIIELVFLI